MKPKRSEEGVDTERDMASSPRVRADLLIKPVAESLVPQERDLEMPTASLELLRPAIERAIAFAREWEEPFRREVFKIAVDRLLGHQSRDAGRSGLRPLARSASPLPDTGIELEQVSPQSKLAASLGVAESVTERSIQIVDGKVVLLARLPGRSKKELQTKYSLVYLYVKETALGSRMVDIEELRELCVEQGCYDLANFTSNFRKDVEAGLLREQGERGARNRRYLLSQQGITTARELLREIAGQ
jgi:hypothetical protein